MSHHLLERPRLLARSGSPSAGTVVDDFDGVLHGQPDGWLDGEMYGPTIPGAVKERQRPVAAGGRP